MKTDGDELPNAGFDGACGVVEAGRPSAYRTAEVATMRFLVLVLRNVYYGDVFGPGGDGSAIELGGESVDPSLRAGQEPVRAVPCVTTREVAAAIGGTEPNCEWTVMSLQGGEWRPQAIRLKLDGVIPYDVELA